MKKLTLLFSLINLIINSTYATVYYPFPSTSGSWNYRYYDEMHLPTQAFTNYVLAGDTLISGVNYQKITKNYSYTGALRENNKVIYFVPDTANHEYVLYDFNLSAGDTVKNRFGAAVCSNGIVTVLYVDSVQLQNGYHRRLNLSTNVQWVEGIGSFNYLLEPSLFYCVSGNDYLECEAGNTGIEYATNTSLCIVAVKEVAKSKYTISVLPNPFTDFVTVQSDKSLQEASYKISDKLGRVCISGKFDATAKIDLSALLNGVYFLSVNEQTFKLIKHSY